MTADQGSMIIITGPPGAGKSTVARIVADQFDSSVLLVGDDFHHYIRKGYIPPWQSESEHQNEVVIDSTAAAAAAYALGGYLVVVDAIIGPWFVRRFLRFVPDVLPVHYVILCPSKEVAIQRAIERTGEADLVNPEPVTFMHQVFTERGGLEDHVLDSSYLTADETASEVLTLVSQGHHLLTR
jgi:cytidylate kinase